MFLANVVPHSLLPTGPSYGGNFRRKTRPPKPSRRRRRSKRSFKKRDRPPWLAFHMEVLRHKKPKYIRSFSPQSWRIRLCVSVRAGGDPSFLKAFFFTPPPITSQCKQTECGERGGGWKKASLPPGRRGGGEGDEN